MNHLLCFPDLQNRFLSSNILFTFPICSNRFSLLLFSIVAASLFWEASVTTKLMDLDNELCYQTPKEHHWGPWSNDSFFRYAVRESFFHLYSPKDCQITNEKNDGAFAGRCDLVQSTGLSPFIVSIFPNKLCRPYPCVLFEHTEKIFILTKSYLTGDLMDPQRGMS